MRLKKTLLVLFTCLFLVSAAAGIAACTATDETKPTYTVTYARGADDATGTIPASQSYEEGETVTLLPATTFSRENYTFLAWSDGTKNYNAGAQFTMPAENVTFTAVWQQNQVTPPEEGEDTPVTAELDAKFYDAANWVYMTNDSGASLDAGEVPYSLDDGSIKFHRANQAIELGDLSNATVSFLLKGTNDWSIWFNSSSFDNAENNSYRLAYAYGGLRIALSSAPEQAAALIVNTSYKKSEWNRFDVVFSTENGVCSIKVYVNGERADLAVGTAMEGVTVEDNVLSHTQPQGFVTGNYVVVKVWEAHNFVQIKPVAQAETEDVPVIACIGASITEGAGAGNFYTESYPAQLQQALGGAYNVINFGNSGKTVRTDLGDDVAWLKQYQWTGVQAIVPDIAILNIGTNDSKTSNDPATTKENFKEAYNYLLDQLLSVNPDMQIYICTVPYAYTDIWDISNDNIRDIIAPVQREIAQERGFTLIDLYEYCQNKSLLFGDGVHPNSTGYAMIVEIIEKVLKEGTQGLTAEFLADIDARYNDKVSDFTATVEENEDAVTLTVSGNTSLTEGIRVYVGTGDDNAQYFDATISDGKFSAAIDLAQLTLGSAWYNVRVYAGGGYHILLMEETQYNAGDSFSSDEVRVDLKSWSSNWGSTFSFTVSENLNVDLLSSVISEAEGKLTLTLSGTTNDSALRLYVGQNPEGDVYREYVDVTVGSDGAFSVSFDLSEMPVGTGWYNVRLYYTDSSYFVVPLAKTTNGSEAISNGDVFYCESTKIEIVSWTDGGVGTLSFDVTEYDGSFVPTVELLSATLKEEEGKILLTLSGTTNDSGIRLYIGNDEQTAEFYHPVTVEEGAFSISFDLAQLAAGSGWYNVRIYYDEEFYENNTDYYTVLYPDVKNANGDALSVGDSFTSADRKVTVQTWGNYNLLSLSVEEYSPAEATVEITSVKFEDGMFVVSGTAQNLQGALDIYLINTNVAGSLNNFVTAQPAQDGQFTVRLSLDTLAGYAVGSNIPFNLRYSLDGGESKINVAKGSMDLSQQYAYGANKYTMGVNGSCVAVYYAAVTYEYTITAAEIRDVDGTPTLILEGTLNDETVAASSLTLVLNKTSSPAQTLTFNNLSQQAGTFSFAVDLSSLELSDQASVSASNPYFLRLYKDGAKLYDVNSVWASDKLFEQAEIGGSVYAFYRNNAGAYYTLGVIRLEKQA